MKKIVLILKVEERSHSIKAILGALNQCAKDFDSPEGSVVLEEIQAEEIGGADALTILMEGAQKICRELREKKK